MLANLSSEQVVGEFVNQMIRDGGYDSLPPDVTAQMTTDLRARLNDRFFAAVVHSLEEADLSQFREILDKGAEPSIVQQFLSSHITNLPDLLSRTMLEFRSDYLGTNL